MGILNFEFKRSWVSGNIGDELKMNRAFRSRSNALRYSPVIASTGLAEQGDHTMSMSLMKRISTKASAPIAGAVLLLAAGAATQAQAVPVSGLGAKAPVVSGMTMTVDHRGGPGRGWDRGHGRHQYELGPRQIRRSLRHRGFHRIKIIDRRGPMYIIKARGWRGFPVRLVVDSRNADIVRSRPLGPRYNWHSRW